MEATLFFRRNPEVTPGRAWTGPAPDWQYETDASGNPASVFFHCRPQNTNGAEPFVQWVIQFLDTHADAIRAEIGEGWDPFLTFVVSADRVRPGQSITVQSAETVGGLSHWGVVVGLYFD